MYGDIVKATFHRSDCCAILLTSDFCRINAVDIGGQTVVHVPACAGLRDVCLATLSRHDCSTANAADTK